MIEKKSTSILWLSDIHWSKDYDKKINIEQFPIDDIKSLSNFQKFINAFFIFLKRYSESNQQIDYLVISGDIANKGLKEDYKSIEKFINKMKSFFHNIQVITVPGNHDVNIGVDERDIEHRFEPFLKIINDQKISTESIEQELFNNEEFFHNLFGDFSEFKEKIQKYNTNIKIDKVDVINSRYKNTVYFDKKNELILFTLNSSWYAFTEDVINTSIADSLLDSLIFKVLSKNTLKLSNDHKDIHKTFNIFLRMHTFLTQYGNQSFGPLEPLESIIEIVKKHKEECEKPVVICSFHHPPAWFIYDDKYKKNGNSIMRKIYDLSDLILTGHEHIEFVNPDILRNKTLFFRAPLFLDKNISDIERKKGVLSNNGFRIITIPADHNNIVERRYEFSLIDNNITISTSEDHEYEINPEITKNYYKNILITNVALNNSQKGKKCQEIIEGFVQQEKKETEEKVKIIYKMNNLKVFYHFNSFYVTNIDYTENNFKTAMQAMGAIKKHLTHINMLLSEPHTDLSDLSTDKYSIPFLKQQKKSGNTPFNSNIYFVNFDFMNSKLKEELSVIESDIQLKEYILNMEMKYVDGFLQFKNAFFNKYEDKYQELIKQEQGSNEQISTLLKEFNIIKECKFISKFVKSIHI